MTTLFTVNYEHVPLVVPDKLNKPSDTPAFEHHVVFVIPPNPNFRSYMLTAPIMDAITTLELRKHVDYRVGKTEAFWPNGKPTGGMWGSPITNMSAHTRIRARFRDKQHALLFRLSFAL